MSISPGYMIFAVRVSAGCFFKSSSVTVIPNASAVIVYHGLPYAFTVLTQIPCPSLMGFITVLAPPCAGLGQEPLDTAVAQHQEPIRLFIIQVAIVLDGMATDTVILLLGQLPVREALFKVSLPWPLTPPSWLPLLRILDLLQLQVILLEPL
jgi:hypothetical protein